MYCTKQQTTCILNTEVRKAIMKLRGREPVEHPEILVTGKAEN
jgi:hypothetical protein